VPDVHPSGPAFRARRSRAARAALPGGPPIHVPARTSSSWRPAQAAGTTMRYSSRSRGLSTIPVVWRCGASPSTSRIATSRRPAASSVRAAGSLISTTRGCRPGCVCPRTATAGATRRRTAVGNAPMAHRADWAAAHRRQCLLGVGERTGECLGVLGERPPCVGQRDAAAAPEPGAVQQPDAGLGFEAGEVLADSGRRQVQTCGCGLDAAVSPHSVQDQQSARIEAHGTPPSLVATGRPTHRLRRSSLSTLDLGSYTLDQRGPTTAPRSAPDSASRRCLPCRLRSRRTGE
jgi:hypothetical protein